MSVTLEQRDACRAKQIARMGKDFTIPESVAAQIRERVAEAWVIIAEDYSGMTLAFSVNPLTSVSNRARHDLETVLMGHYGNAPFGYYTDFSPYRLAFTAQ